MNKKEAIEKIKALKPDEQCLHEYQPEEWEAFQDGFDDGKCYVELIIEQIDEPEKPVVPQFVADFYESIKDGIENNIYDLCVQFNLDASELNSDVAGWFDQPKNKPIETLVMMHKFGYEVEKEKLYTVEIPNPNRADVSLVLGLYNDGKVAIFAAFTDSWKYEKQYKLTEAEIKQDFEWAWQFAKEVKE